MVKKMEDKFVLQTRGWEKGATAYSAILRGLKIRKGNKIKTEVNKFDVNQTRGWLTKLDDDFWKEKKEEWILEQQHSW